MSIDQYGRMDPPECDTPDGVLKRVRVLEQTVNEQTKVLKEVSVMFVDITSILKDLGRR